MGTDPDRFGCGCSMKERAIKGSESVLVILLVVAMLLVLDRFDARSGLRRCDRPLSERLAPAREKDDSL
jgi:hypothetical protein